ncbi:protein kinase [Nannocystis sp. ncelm1]|uniref:Protein kinase n=1 Tax=Nannocystis radixulma TaxID=2995305 RepID=A0ABT5BGR9_9BACT|nr:protein kinase [Nannocystis radixulma]
MGVTFADDGAATLTVGATRVPLGAEALQSLAADEDALDEPQYAALREALAATPRSAASLGPDETPLVMGDYVIFGLLGHGSFGTVFAARDIVSDERVALKVLREVDPWTLQAFKNEARFLVDVFDPQLLVPDELVEQAGRLALVMRLVDGCDVRHALAEAAGPTGRLRDPAAIAEIVAGLLRAVATLHASGIVHMDLKPGNVLVTAQREVNVLDFGLSRLLAAPDPDDADGISGTPVYMAPEQLMGAAPTPEMDLYAVGVLLYESFSGALPLDGVDGDVVFGRIYADPLPLAARRPGLEDMWCALTDALLAREPAARPAPAQLIERIVGAAHPLRHGPHSPLLGRDSELEQLQRVWSESQGGLVRVSLLAGEPGVGKTGLARGLAAHVRAAAAAMVVWGRCYEREAIPYKALDAAVTQLCDLVRVDGELRRAVAAIPKLGALGRIFAAFRTIAEPDEERALEESEIGELLARVVMTLTARCALLIVVDDCQWGDSDSAGLLLQILTHPEASRLMVVLTHRAHEWQSAPFAQVIEARIAKGVPFGTHRLHLSALSESAALHMAAALQGTDIDDPRVRRTIEAAGGNPFLIERHGRALREGDHALPPIELLHRQLSQWPTPVQWFVECAALAGAATPVSVLARAADVAIPDRTTLAGLRAAGLLRHEPGPQPRAVVCYHDLVRQAILSRIDPRRGIQLHAGLARALMRSGADPGVVAWHLFEAGAGDEARDWALRGAAAAERAFAFARAAHLLELGLTVDGPSPVQRRELRLRRAEAQLAAGLGAQATAAFLDLAADAGAPADARAMQRRAAEAAMVAGDTERGLAILAPVLRQLDLAAPARGLAGALRLAAELSWAALRGRSLRPSPRFDARAAERSDTCWVAAKGLVFIDPLPGLEFLLRSLRHGAHSGSRPHLARAMGILSASLFGHVSGFRSLAGRWLEALREWSRDDAGVDATYALWSSLQAFGRGELERALELGRAALDRTATLSGATWERVQAAAIVGRTLRSQGQYTACIELGRAHFRDAERRGDRYAQMLFGDVQVLPLIAAGCDEEARSRIAWLRETWMPGRYTVQSFYVMLHLGYADLYAGRPELAARRLVRERADFRRAGGYRIVFSRLDHILLESRIALADLDARHPGLLAPEHLLQQLAREELPEAQGNAALLRAAIHRRAGRTDAALAGLATAEACFDRAGIAMEGQAVRLRRAQLLGDGDAAARATAHMRRLGARDPSRWAHVVAPGFTTAADETRGTP